MMSVRHIGPSRLVVRTFSRQLHQTSPAQHGETNFDDDSIKYANAVKDQQIFVRLPNTFISTPIDEKYRIGNFPLYEGPSTQYISTIKRVSMGFSIIGLYISYLFQSSELFTEALSATAVVVAVTPVPIVQYYTRNYVTRIFRVYDRTKPQTLDNLVADEKLIMEKLNWSGRKTYHQLVHMKDLRLMDRSVFQLANWQEKLTNNKIRKYHVIDDIGGLKMDRIWGIVERNSDVDNGRYLGR